MDDTITGDQEIQRIVDGYIQQLDQVLGPAGLGFANVIAETAFDLDAPPLQESRLGNLITDAYRESINTLQPGAPVLMTFEANGLILDGVRRGRSGKLWFADLYRAIPLGIGPDQQPGYPLVTFYLTAKGRSGRDSSCWRAPRTSCKTTITFSKYRG